VPHDPEPTAPGAELVRPAAPRSWRERLEHLADATGTTPARIVVGAALIAAAAVGGAWLTRAPADPVEVSLPYASSTTVAADAPSTTEPSTVVVHVAGAVLRPGVYELAAEARVVDAVTAAGGLAEGADEVRLNLAAPISDGERVYVPLVGEDLPPSVGSTGSTTAGGAPTDGGPVDLNVADEAALDALPGVGPATAAAIVEHRQRIGRFTSVDQLLDVRGIGEAKLEALRDLVTV